jgi:hypothetical protein
LAHKSQYTFLPFVLWSSELDAIKMPRKFDKYGFNRQYLRRPCTRANPFPYRIPFDDGFSTRALVYTMVTRPSTKVKSNVLAASVTRSGKEYKGARAAPYGKRMKLSEVAAIVSERESELGALAMKGGELTSAIVQGGIAVEALYNTLRLVRRGTGRRIHRHRHRVRN